MNQITSDQVTSQLRNLFHIDDPEATRCFNVLAGVEPRGKILTDDIDNPTWSVVQESYDGTVFLGGEIDEATATQIFNSFRQQGGVIVLLPDDDPRLKLLPPDPHYDGRILEFYDRPIGRGLDHILSQIPDDLALRRLDRELIMRTQWGPDDVEWMGGLDAWERNCFGYVLMRGDEILSEATVGPAATGLREPGVITHEDHRRKGYGTITSARLVQEIESLGDRTFWNCTKQNVGSAAIARNLGYTVEKEFRNMHWKPL
ncbi:GNAT family N-acetyltransferase [Chloroflexi bacterium TSY]|nr:GNAT family N-acetyltransferase [Chloroflexi bacterium TSY]